MVTLVYTGGSTLTFGTGSGRRIISHGIPFQVEERLAAVLLRDPHVDLAPAADASLSSPPGERSSNGPSDVPRETSLADMTKAELLAAAGNLGLDLPKRATNVAIAKAIEAEQKRLAKTAKADEKRLADEAAAAGAADETSSDGEGNEGGEDAPGDDSEASATDEPGTPPSSTGAITLGDLPEGAKVKKGT